MQLDHVGLAVHNLDRALQFHCETLGGALRHREPVQAEGVEIAFVDQTELLSPVPGQASAIQRFLDRHGEGLHHVAYLVNDLTAKLEALESAGLRLVEGYPRPGAFGRNAAFLHPKSCGGVLIELCENKEETT